MISDNIDSKTPKPPPVVKKKTSPKNICKISFNNRTIEKINISCIFHGPLVKADLPNTPAHFDNTTAVYTFLNPTGSKILAVISLLIILM